MMHDGIRLASNTGPKCGVCVKGPKLWHFQDLGQFCTCTSCCGHTLSSAQDHKNGNLDRPPVC